MIPENIHPYLYVLYLFKAFFKLALNSKHKLKSTDSETDFEMSEEKENTFFKVVAQSDFFHLHENKTLTG